MPMPTEPPAAMNIRRAAAVLAFGVVQKTTAVPFPVGVQFSVASIDIIPVGQL